MLAVFKRELKAYLCNVYGLLFAAVLLLAIGFLVFNINLGYGMSDFSYSLTYGEYVLVVMLPILCMRSMAEDRRNKTDMFYLSLPISTASVVLGKYFALLATFTLPMLIVAFYPLILCLYGDVNLAGAYAALLTFYLLGAALIAVCMFLSSLTDNLIVAAVMSVAATLILFFLAFLASLIPSGGLASFIAFAVLAAFIALIAGLITKKLMASAIVAAVLIIPLSVLYIILPDAFSGLFSEVLTYISPFVQFENIAYLNLFDLRSVVLLLSFCVFFVLLTVQSADKRRWS